MMFDCFRGNRLPLHRGRNLQNIGSRFPTTPVGEPSWQLHRRQSPIELPLPPAEATWVGPLSSEDSRIDEMLPSGSARSPSLPTTRQHACAPGWSYSFQQAGLDPREVDNPVQRVVRCNPENAPACFRKYEIAVRSIRSDRDV